MAQREPSLSWIGLADKRFRLPRAGADDGGGHGVPRPAVSNGWSDLSDDELRARLVQRGVDAAAARFLVTHREEPLAAKMIAELLDN
jgi:hypothetical protein